MFVLCSVYSYSFVVCRFRPHTGHGSHGVILRHEGGAEGVIKVKAVFLRYTSEAVGQPSGNKDLTPVHILHYSSSHIGATPTANTIRWPSIASHVGFAA